ncbi:hypothetical protein [Methanolapillus africanus]
MVMEIAEEEETKKLKEKLDLAEKSRLIGDRTYTIEESRKLLEKIYDSI